MKPNAQPLDLRALRMRPLAERRSLCRVADVLLDPSALPPEAPAAVEAVIADCAGRLRAARARGAGVLLIFGAHLVRNGAAPLLDRLMERGWLTHLATNGAGSIHDWEFAWLGASTEDVAANVADGTFGCWRETSASIHLAVMAGALDGLGYGAALGRFIEEDGATVPPPEDLERLLREAPAHPLAGARADLLQHVRAGFAAPGRVTVEHRWKAASVTAAAWRRGVPLTVHPGIGYDIIACHPGFNGAAIGRAADLDFRAFAGSVDTLDGGVVVSVGTAVMGPQVFEKALSCVHNLRRQRGAGPVRGHSIYVVDLQDAGGWDWAAGEPPKTHPAYYLRFCKSFSRMGGDFRYVRCDNALFCRRLLARLEAPA